MVLAYEFVEAFSSVVPQVRVSQVLAITGVVLDVLWRLVTWNPLGPAYVDILAALLIGYYLGKRPRGPKSEKQKSSWIRLS